MTGIPELLIDRPNQQWSGANRFFEDVALARSFLLLMAVGPGSYAVKMTRV
jgi:hypothetical protein